MLSFFDNQKYLAAYNRKNLNMSWIETRIYF